MENLTGQAAPDFSLADETGKIHSLADYRGKKVLLYFYPKDMTSGCTVEAQCFRDRTGDLRAYGVEVLGVSPDSIDSHKKFKEKEHLNFPLLADDGHKIAEKYGVWVEKSMYGRKYMGIARESFLIDEKGMIVKHYQKVNPKTHVDEIAEDLKSGVLVS